MYISPTCLSPSPPPKGHFSLIQQNNLNTRNAPGLMVSHGIITPNPNHSSAEQALPHVNRWENLHPPVWLPRITPSAGIEPNFELRSSAPKAVVWLPGAFSVIENCKGAPSPFKRGPLIASLLHSTLCCYCRVAPRERIPWVVPSELPVSMPERPSSRLTTVTCVRIWRWGSASGVGDIFPAVQRGSAHLGAVWRPGPERRASWQEREAWVLIQGLPLHAHTEACTSSPLLSGVPFPPAARLPLPCMDAS